MIQRFFTVEDFSGETPQDIIEHLRIKVYSPEMFGRYEQEVFQTFPEPLQTILLIIDFDTEVAMNGILGFLENSTGLYLDETIEAFARIGALQTSTILAEVKTILKNHQTSAQNLRDEVNQMPLYSITSFLEMHGEHSKGMTDEIGKVTANLYVDSNSASAEPVYLVFQEYVARWRLFLIHQVSN